ncbi:MAG: hypothetical protein QNJ18_01775 [Xenococcaceae cyanobacterium MO_167.B52]|nr:hypothetical protein [Xenococcaceae cyanobacterium MO_167.B52]
MSYGRFILVAIPECLSSGETPDVYTARPTAYDIIRLDGSLVIEAGESLLHYVEANKKLD